MAILWARLTLTNGDHTKCFWIYSYNITLIKREEVLLLVIRMGFAYYNIQKIDLEYHLQSLGQSHKNIKFYKT